VCAFFPVFLPIAAKISVIFTKTLVFEVSFSSLQLQVRSAFQKVKKKKKFRTILVLIDYRYLILLIFVNFGIRCSSFNRLSVAITSVVVVVLLLLLLLVLPVLLLLVVEDKEPELLLTCYLHRISVFRF
jgi:hypothetical protein